MADTPLETAVSLAAVQAQFGEQFEEPELTQVHVWIERARDEMLEHAPTLNADLTAGRVREIRARGVGVDCVIRAVENSRIGHRVTRQEFPELKTDYAASGDESIYLTASEIGRLQPTGGVADVAPANGGYIVSLSG